MLPNVLCVVFDTARADSLEPYGAAAGSSPTVAQLASTGVALQRAYATACWTLPSHASMLTGLLPRAARLASPHSDGTHPRDLMAGLANRFLPAVLRENGYRTAAVSANLWISKANGFDTGFDEFVIVNTGRQAKIHVEGLPARLRWAVEGIRAGVDDGAAACGEVLRRWFEAADDRPWFRFVNLIECHSPYLPPRPYNDLGPIERWRAAEEARRHLTLGAIWRACVADFDVPDGVLERMRRLYARSIRYMDDWLAEILERLDAHGILDDTLVVVLSDHGENFGEGGLLAHAFSLDDRLIRVPVIASGPGAEAFEDRLTTLAELPSILARATGLAAHPWESDALPGAAVAQFDPPVPADHPRAEEVIEAWDLDDAAFRRLTTPFVAATDGRLKLVHEGTSERLYDLSSDPLEVAPLPAGSLDDDEALATLRAALEHPATTASAPPGDIPGGGPGARRGAPDPEEVAKLEEQMKLLGYM